MLRRIVLLRPHEPLANAWKNRSFGPAGLFLLQNLQVGGMSLEEGSHPVPVAGRNQAGVPSGASAFRYGQPGTPPAYTVVSHFDDEDAVQRLKHDRQNEVLGVFVDPAVTHFVGVYCGRGAVGGAADVAQFIGANDLSAAGFTGKGVRMAIVDTGIDGTIVPVAGGWGPNPGYVPGSITPPEHGTMCGFDTRIAAPDTAILDYALRQSQGGTWTAFLSDAIAAFADLINLVQP